MSSKTTNFNLHKIDLTDAPPDITVLNQNWDKIDQELLKGQRFIVNISDNGDNFKADKTFSEVLAAYNAGKTLMAYYNDYKLPLTMLDVSQYFAFQTGTDSGYVAFSIMVDNTVFGIFETFSYSDHHHFPSDIKSGTFASYVKANASNQDPATSLIRNSALVSADTNPTVNGEIFWTYK